MALRTVDIGNGPNTGTGDTLRDGMQKVNDNFAELFAHANAVADTLTFQNGNAVVTGDLIPAEDLTYNLGSAEKRWHSLFIGADTIYLGNTTVLAGTSICITGDPNANSLAQMPTLIASKLLARPFSYAGSDGSTVTVRPSIEFQAPDGTSYPISFNTSTYEFSLDAAGNYGTGSLVAKKVTLSNPGGNTLALTGDIVQTGNVTRTGSTNQTGNLRVDGNTTLGYDVTSTLTFKGTSRFREAAVFDASAWFEGPVTLGNGGDVITIDAGASSPFLVTSNTLTLTTTGATFPGNVTVQGNLTIQGSTTAINSNQVNIGDNILILNSDMPGYLDPTENAGIQISRGTESAVKWIWDEVHDYWTPMGGDIGNVNSLTVGTLTATSISAHAHTASNITDLAEAVDDRVATLLQAGSNISLSYNDAAGTLTIAATGGGNLTFTGDVTGSGNGTVGLTLADTGVTAGTYGSTTAVARVTVDSKGRITTASNMPIAFPVTSIAGRTGDVTLVSSDIVDASAANAPGALVKRDGVGNFAAGTITANLSGNASSATKLATARTLSLGGDASGSATFDGSADATLSVALASTGVAAGTYGSATAIPTITVDGKGRVTAISTAAVAAGVSSVAGKTGTVTLASADISDATSANTANMLVKRDASGGFSAGTITADLSGNAASASKLQTARLLTLSGDVTGWVAFDGSTNATVATALANSGVTAGTYGSGSAIPTLTIDAKGRVTSASATSLPDASTSQAGLVQLSTATDSTSTAMAATPSAVKAAYDLAAAAFPASGGTVSGNLTLTGNLVVNGTTTTVNSTVTTIDDPVLTLGGDTAPAADNFKDRGIEFRWHDGVAPRTGFFGFINNTSCFSFIPYATNNGEVFSGEVGAIQATLVGDVSGNVEGNAATASKLALPRTISFTGDAAGSASFDGSSDISVTTTLADTGVTAGIYGDSGTMPPYKTVKLTVDAKGRITNAVTQTITFPVTSVAGRTGDVTLASADIGDATAASTPGKIVLRDAGGNFAANTVTAALSGNASTASKLQTARTITLTGSVSGSASFDGSGDISITTTGGSSVAIATQAEAEDGTDNTKMMTPLRVNQAIAQGEIALTGGYTAASDSDGTFASGTYTPTPTGGNFKAITNGGAFTLAAPTATGVYTMIVEITNSATAGAVTFTGFAKVVGALTTTSGNKFQIFIAKTASGVTANIVAMQ